MLKLQLSRNYDNLTTILGYVFCRKCNDSINASTYVLNNYILINLGQPVGCPVAMLWEFYFLCQAEAQGDSVDKAAFFVVSA